jgi:hypothetical protein
MTDYSWIDRGDERILYLDDPARPGARHLLVRRQPGGEDTWVSACVLEPGGPEREVGDGLEVGFAEDVILKYAIQALAQQHGVSPVPGLPDEDAGEAEVIIARLWRVLTARWAPPEGAAPPPPSPEGDEG